MIAHTIKKLLTYKVRKNCNNDIRVNLGHQITKFTKKKDIFLFSIDRPKGIKNFKFLT